MHMKAFSRSSALLLGTATCQLAENAGQVHTMRMLCLRRLCFVNKRNRLLTSLSGMLLCSATTQLTTPVSVNCQRMSTIHQLQSCMKGQTLTGCMI